jgi:hypothetical protein
MDDRHDQIKQLERRTLQYWYVDGLAELATGVVSLALALLLLLAGLARPGSLIARFNALAVPVIIIGGALLSRLVVRALKERLTYPRSGYVVYRSARPRKRWLNAVIGGGVGALTAVLIVTRSDVRALLPALEGLLLGLAWFFAAGKLGLRRFYVLAALSAIAGVAAMLAGLDESLGAALVFGIMGLGLLGTGAFALRHYLLTTLPPVAEG